MYQQQQQNFNMGAG